MLSTIIISEDAILWDNETWTHLKWHRIALEYSEGFFFLTFHSFHMETFLILVLSSTSSARPLSLEGQHVIKYVRLHSISPLRTPKPSSGTCQPLGTTPPPCQKLLCHADGAEGFSGCGRQWDAIGEVVVGQLARNHLRACWQPLTLPSSSHLYPL